MLVRVSGAPPIAATEIRCGKPPSPAEVCRSDFGAVAKALWPDKTAHALADEFGAGERTVRDWLAGRTEPWGCVIAEIVRRCTHPRRD